MSVSADDAATMAFLSWAAYDRSPSIFDPINNVQITAQDNLDGSGWTALGLADLNLADGATPLPASSFNANGFFIEGPAAALVTKKGDVRCDSWLGRAS